MNTDKISSFLLIILLCFFTILPPEIYDPSFSVFIVASMLLFILVLLQQKQAPLLPVLALAFIVYFLLLHSFFSATVQFSSLLLFISYGLLLLSLYQFLNDTMRHSIIKTITFLTIILSLYAFYQFFYGYQQDYASLLPYKDHPFIGKTLAYLKNKRVSSTFALPTVFSAFLMISLPFTIYAISAFKKWMRICAVFAMVVSLFAAFLSQSYFIFPALFLLLISLLFFRVIPIPKRYFYPLLLAAIIVSILIPGLMRKDLSSQILQSNTIQMRLGNWRIAINMMKDNLLWGVGIGNFHRDYPNYMTASDIETKYAHNFFLQFPAETGLLGIVIIIAIAASFIYSLIEIIRNNSASMLSWACVTSLIIFIAYSAIDISFYFPSIGFYGVLCVSLYLLEYKKMTAREPVPVMKLTTGVKFIAFFFVLIALITGFQLHRLQRNFQHSLDDIKKGTLKKASLSAERYIEYFPTDIAAATLLVDTAKYASSPEERTAIYNKAGMYFYFSPRVHYMIGKLNMNDVFYYNAFMNFSISHQLYPPKQLYNDAYKNSLNLIDFINEEKNNRKY